jgi:hypothetical protein
MIALILKTKMQQMKSILTALALTIVSASVMAQSIDDIKGLASKQQWEKAKEGIDKYLANEKNAKKGEGWFLKTQIYNSIARDAALSVTYPDARLIAFEAYKQYLIVDPKAVEGVINQHSPLFDIAFGYQEVATNDFNAKKYDQALKNFQSAELVETYIVGKQYTYGQFQFPAFDTQLYLNVAASAINAKKEDVAVTYYQKIADKKIKDKSFDEIYRFLVDYYDKKGDAANTQKYLNIGKELYPTDDFWCEVGLKNLDGDKKKLFAKYDELLAQGCDNYYTRYNYAVEMFNYAYVGDNNPADRPDIEKKIEEVLKKALEQKADGVEANMLMTRHHFAIIKTLGDQYDAIKGVKPEDVKKKNDINAQIGKKYDDAFPYMSAVYNYYNAKGASTLKPGEKGQFKIVTSMMLEYWESKKDKTKITEFQAKLKSIE